MNSCAYVCRLKHDRPNKNSFTYNIYMYYLDLDELDLLAKRFKLFGKNRWNLLSFYDEDHFIFVRQTGKPDRIARATFDYTGEKHLRNPGFIKKHIFPGGELLSLRQVKSELERNGLKLEDEEDISESYVKTLLAWREKFHLKKEEILSLGFDEALWRKWDYYLTSYAVGFDTKYIADVQLSIEKTCIS